MRTPGNICLPPSPALPVTTVRDIKAQTLRDVAGKSQASQASLPQPQGDFPVLHSSKGFLSNDKTGAGLWLMVRTPGF